MHTFMFISVILITKLAYCESEWIMPKCEANIDQIFIKELQKIFHNITNDRDNYCAQRLQTLLDEGKTSEGFTIDCAQLIRELSKVGGYKGTDAQNKCIELIVKSYEQQSKGLVEVVVNKFWTEAKAKSEAARMICYGDDMKPAKFRFIPMLIGGIVTIATQLPLAIEAIKQLQPAAHAIVSLFVNKSNLFGENSAVFGMAKMGFDDISREFTQLHRRFDRLENVVKNELHIKNYREIIRPIDELQSAYSIFLDTIDKNTGEPTKHFQDICRQRQLQLLMGPISREFTQNWPEGKSEKVPHGSLVSAILESTRYDRRQYLNMARSIRSDLCRVAILQTICGVATNLADASINAQLRHINTTFQLVVGRLALGEQEILEDFHTHVPEDLLRLVTTSQEWEITELAVYLVEQLKSKYNWVDFSVLIVDSGKDANLAFNEEPNTVCHLKTSVGGWTFIVYINRDPSKQADLQANLKLTTEMIGDLTESDCGSDNKMKTVNTARDRLKTLPKNKQPALIASGYEKKGHFSYTTILWHSEGQLISVKNFSCGLWGSRPKFIWLTPYCV